MDLQLALSRSGRLPEYSVQIRLDSSSRPGGLVGTLDNPDTLGNGINQFTAPGAGLDLAAGETYHLVWDVTTTFGAREFGIARDIVGQ